MRKSYNPFKMLGSYVGAVLFYIIFILYGSFNSPIACNLGEECQNAIIYTLKNSFSGSGGLISMPAPVIIITIVGFLFGWGVTSLFRRFVK